MKSNCSPTFHYTTMSNEDLLAFDFAQAAAPNAMCAIWCPVSQVELGLQIMKRNDFKFVTTAVWSKVTTSGAPANCATKGAILPQHELLLVGRRGAGIPIPKGVNRIPGVITAVRQAHSQKPAVVHHELARMFGQSKEGHNRVLLELFARRPEKGWKVWGNQAP